MQKQQIRPLAEGEIDAVQGGMFEVAPPANIFCSLIPGWSCKPPVWDPGDGEQAIASTTQLL